MYILECNSHRQILIKINPPGNNLLPRGGPSECMEILG